MHCKCIIIIIIFNVNIFNHPHFANEHIGICFQFNFNACVRINWFCWFCNICFSYVGAVILQSVGKGRGHCMGYGAEGAEGAESTG